MSETDPFATLTNYAEALANFTKPTTWVEQILMVRLGQQAESSFKDPRPEVKLDGPTLTLGLLGIRIICRTELNYPKGQGEMPIRLASYVLNADQDLVLLSVSPVPATSKQPVTAQQEIEFFTAQFLESTIRSLLSLNNSEDCDPSLKITMPPSKK